MSEQMQTILGIGLVVLLIVLGIIGRRKRVKSSWKGRVVGKNMINDEGGKTYRVVFETTGGKKVKMFMKKKDFEKFREGDTVEKRSGEYNPTRV